MSDQGQVTEHYQGPCRTMEQTTKLFHLFQLFHPRMVGTGFEHVERLAKDKPPHSVEGEPVDPGRDLNWL